LFLPITSPVSTVSSWRKQLSSLASSLLLSDWATTLVADGLTQYTTQTKYETGGSLKTEKKTFLNTAREIIGSWHIIGLEQRDNDGNIFFPMGLAPSGTLIYSADGQFSVIFTAEKASKASPFVSHNWQKVKSYEAQIAVQSTVAYAGFYSVLPERIVHEVQTSLFPNWRGTQQINAYHYYKDALTIHSMEWAAPTGSRCAKAIWLRGKSGWDAKPLRRK
jgi:hypothetical protein